MNRRIETHSCPSDRSLTSYSWSGNVRELQNFIERAVILSPGSVLRPPLAELKEAAVETPSAELSTLEEVEREHVLTGDPSVQLGARWSEGCGRTLRYEADDLGLSHTQTSYSASSSLNPVFLYTPKSER